MIHGQLKIRPFLVVLIFVSSSVLSFSLNNGFVSGKEPYDVISANTFYFSSGSLFGDSRFDFNADSVVIPLKRAGKLFLIEASIDGVEGNIVLDTGAGGLVVNSTYFRDHVKTSGTYSGGINGSVGKISKVTIEKMDFANLHYKNMRADLVDLGHIENKRNVKIIGLIGFNLIRDLEIVIDAKNSELKLYRIDKSGNRVGKLKEQFQLDYKQDFYEKSDILFLKADVGGKTLSFCFDTGAETNVLSSYAKKDILNTITITRRKVLKGAGKTSSEVLYGRMNDFMIGGRKITGMETIITNLNALSEVYDKPIYGMLGCSFMENGVICINFVKKQFAIRYWKGGEK